MTKYKKEFVPQTFQEIVADRLSIFENINNITLEEIQNETLEKLSKLSLEEHIKFIYTIPNGLSDITTNAEQVVSAEDKAINDELTAELKNIKKELSKYEIGNPELEQEIIEKFGQRCYDLRIKQSNQGNKLLYKFFIQLETTPSQLLIKGKQKYD